MSKQRKKDAALAREMRSLIAKTGLTKEELAEKVGVSTREIYNYQDGRSQPKMRAYQKMIALAR